MSVRLTANRLMPRYAAAQEQARADAVQWLRVLFGVDKARSLGDQRSLTNEVIATFPKREDRVGYFLAILRDETKPRPVRMAAVSALMDENCFDYKRPFSQISSDIFSSLLSLLKSKDGEVRKAGAGNVGSVCRRIKSPGNRKARAKEAISSLDVAIAHEQDKDVLAYMKMVRPILEEMLRVQDRSPLAAQRRGGSDEGA
jgi:hypothetical protein